VRAAPATCRPAATPARPTRRPGVASLSRVELVQLVGQPRTQVAAVGCLLAPLAVVIVTRLVGTVPSDTLFGRWLPDGGMALPLVMLGFAGQWGIPALMSLMAADVFAAEDRHGTWPALMTRSTTRGRIFAGKAVSATGVGLGLVALLGASAILCGRLLGPTQPLLGLSGQELAGDGLTGLVVMAWLTQLLPALVFGSLAVMLSVLTRSAASGTAGPVVLGLLASLVGMAGLPEWLRELLPGTGFETWHGLLAQPAFLGPLLRTSLVCVWWIALFLLVAWRVFARRDVRTS